MWKSKKRSLQMECIHIYTGKWLIPEKLNSRFNDYFFGDMIYVCLLILYECMKVIHVKTNRIFFFQWYHKKLWFKYCCKYTWKRKFCSTLKTPVYKSHDFIMNKPIQKTILTWVVSIWRGSNSLPLRTSPWKNGYIVRLPR